MEFNLQKPSITPTIMTLLQFLRQARQVHLQFLAGALIESPIYVLGNPSADLDSIISAILYSYCANNRLPATTSRPHVPLLNLSNVPAGPELYRLRPEFVTALWLSTNAPALRPEEHFDNSPDSGNLLREHIVTIADFAQAMKELPTPKQLTVDATLVDWNALPERTPGREGQGSLGGALPGVLFRAVGCIDHHADEHFMPGVEALPTKQPLIIQLGPGSCSSLVTHEMQRRGFWSACADASSAAEVAQVAKLGLAAMLIDTSNLTAEGKVTEVDVQAVELLRGRVTGATGNSESEWDIEAFYEQVLKAKQNSLDLLTLEEVLDRDYKDWTETMQSSGESVKLGFCSSVKPVRWIVRKAGGPRELLDGISSFAAKEDKKLDVVVVMTSFTSKVGEFSRELLVCATSDRQVALDGINSFISKATSQLQLVAVDGESVDMPEDRIRSTLDGDAGLWSRLWSQKNTTASRKQVAPMLRTAVAKL